MARRNAPKNLQLFRAVYAANARTLQHYVNAACQAVLVLTDREVAHPTLGALRINWYTQDRNGVYVHLVAKVTGEAAFTVSDSRGARNDQEVAVPPPLNRAYKTADLFALIRGNHLVVCTDGVRLTALEYYLKAFFHSAGQSNNSVQFEIERVPNAETVAVLQRGGVKEIKLQGSLYNATVERIQEADRPVGGLAPAFRSLTDQLAAVFGKDEDDEFAAASGDMQVEVIVKARGGIRAEPVLRESLEEVGINLLDEVDGDREIGYQIKTNDNKVITGSDMSVAYPVMLQRVEGGNSLVRGEVLDKLVEAMNRFAQEGDLDL